MSPIKLVDRLRDLEIEALALSVRELPSQALAIKDVYVERLNALDASHSRSWFGEHANTYYEGFNPPPAGRSFDVEWGFVPGFSGKRNKGWRTYAREEVRAFVFDGIAEAIFYDFNELSESINGNYSTVRDQALDIVDMLNGAISSSSLSRYVSKMEGLKPYTFADYVNARMSSAPKMTRDSEEVSKGMVVPLHIQYLSTVQSLAANKERARELAVVVRSLVEIIALSQEVHAKAEKGKARVFIGHGRSEQWRKLKDFVQERLGLEYDEFNRIPIAGITTQERLREMLEQCDFALIVMTAEDEDADGVLHARENVIHEVGLFQGRYGLRRAVILLEDGCSEFSNIQGLGQIRFDRGAIGTCYEEVRRVLEREGLLKLSI